MGRKPLEITKEQLIEALKKNKTQKRAGEELGISQASVCNLIVKFEIGPELIGKTPREEIHEMPNYDFDDLKEILFKLQDKFSPTVGYDVIDIEIKTDMPILIIPSGDWHIGARYVDYRRLMRDVEFIKNTPNVYTVLIGDYCDNYNTSAYKQGQMEQAIAIQDQKAVAETIIKELSDVTLAIINGCHDEWSFFNDGFDFAKYLAEKSFAYYMGHNGIINLKVGNVDYKVFITHNTFRNSSINDGHGLKSVLREGIDFDIGVKAHNHKPHAEEFSLKGERKWIVSTGAYKGMDRYASKGGFPQALRCVPGILLDPNEKKVLINIDYTQLIDYL